MDLKKYIEGKHRAKVEILTGLEMPVFTLTRDGGVIATIMGENARQSVNTFVKEQNLLHPDSKVSCEQSTTNKTPEVTPNSLSINDEIFASFNNVPDMREIMFPLITDNAVVEGKTARINLIGRVDGQEFCNGEVSFTEADQTISSNNFGVDKNGQLSRLVACTCIANLNEKTNEKVAE